MATKRVWNLEAAVYSALRRAHRNSPEYHEVLKLAKSEYFIQSKKGKPMRRVHFACAQCGKKYSRKGVAIDHVQPVVPVTGKTNFDDYVKRLFCGVKGLQVLCKDECHRLKSKHENAQRRALKKGKNI